MPQITQLDNDPTPNNNDLLVTVDMAAGTTKNISRQQFFTGAPLPANTVNTQALTDGSVTSAKQKATTFDGLMTFGTITTAGYVAASVVLPSTPVAHKYSVVAAFTVGHAGSSSVRDYNARIALGGVTEKQAQWTATAGTFVNTIPVAAIISTTGSTLTFVCSRNTDNGGQVLATSHYTIVDLGLA